MPMELNAIVAAAKDKRASDIHLVRGLPPRVRIDGALQNFGAPLSAADCEYYARQMAGADYASIEKMGELDLAITFPGKIRCRINLFRQQGAVPRVSAVFAQ